MHVGLKKRRSIRLRYLVIVVIAGIVCTLCAALIGGLFLREQVDSHVVLERAGNSVFPVYLEGRSNELAIGVPAMTGDFDTRLNGTVGDAVVSKTIFEPLMTNDRSGKPKMVLAQSYKVSQDGLSYTFTLRKNLVFSDGTPLDAETVKANFLAIRSSQFESEDAIIINGNIISFSFKNHDPERIWMFTLGIQPKGQLYAQGDDKKYIGTGAYMLDPGFSGQYTGEVVLVRNERYRLPKGKMERVRFICTEPATLTGMFGNGELDLAFFGYDMTGIENALQNSYVSLYSTPGNRSGYMGFNLRNELFHDERVRKAFAHAIDYDRILDVLYDGYADVNPSPFSIVSWASPPDLSPYQYDVDRAKALLAEAGYGAGDISFTLYTYNGTHALGVCSLIAEDLAEIGVKVSIEQMPFGELQDKVWTYQDFEAYYANWNHGLSEDIFTRFGSPSPGVNPEGWYPDEIGRILSQISEETNFDKKAKLYQEIAILYKDQVPQIPIDTPRSFVAASSAVKGLSLSPYVIPFWNSGELQKAK